MNTMAIINYEFYTGTDIYNDGDAEELLLKFYKGEYKSLSDTDELFYLTTHIRENILNWYPFTKSAEVLEVGCGCGTLTDMLCRRCAKVYSVEGSKRRAQITYERNKTHRNLYVYAGEFGKFNISRKFDYIILIGVLEYAKRFFKEYDDPLRKFLKEIKKVLKPTGKLLLAIENRYGLKYWAGADEDHLRKPYIGFSDYDKYDVQTFGKQELISLCLEMGWEKYKFYYPFPDYKLPEVIYTEEYLPGREDINLLPIFLYGSNSNFDIRGTYQGLRDNAQFGFFSNSFLLECGTSKCELADVVYAKELSYRHTAYRTITIKSKGTVFKKMAATKEAFQHLQQIHKNHVRIAQNGIQVAATKVKKDNSLWIELIGGQKLADKFWNLAAVGENDRIESEFMMLLNYYKQMSVIDIFHNPACQKLLHLYPEGTDILKLSLIDGNASNIIVDNNGNYILIDQEWIFEKQLPVDYLMFYSIVHICNVCEIPAEPILEKFKITKEKSLTFKKITEDYYQSRHIIESHLQKRLYDLNWINNRQRNNIDVCPVCYYDTGFGFNESQKIYGEYKRCGEFWSASFQLPPNITTIRIDPALCGEKCLYYTTILINDRPVNYKEYNITTWNGKKILNKRNPYVVLEQAVTIFEIKIDLKPLSTKDIEDCFRLINSKVLIE